PPPPTVFLYMQKTASDMDLARQSKDIDIIIGGHSHTYVNPATPDKTPYWINNAVGKPVLVTQTGKYGRNLGYINIDLDAINKVTKDGKRHFDYMYIPVTDRFSPEAYDKDIIEFLAPYKHAVDSVNSKVIGWSLQDMPNNDHAGAYSNWVADFALNAGRRIADGLRSENPGFPQVDMSFMNVGGIRQPMKKGAITEGQILSTFPFSNRMEIIEIKGKDIIEALKIASIKGGEGISGNVIVVNDADGNLKNVYIDGIAMDPEQTYTVSTIDYISQGNDDYVTMANNRILWQDDVELSRQILDYIEDLTAKGIPVSSNPYGRFVTAPILTDE
ncbi:MAG: 5'-nucleotidase C-terminal domain-containing protein, partial [Muribaculaceae bacterium]|nr:5'-nucleotidase C-terminal domain-containing protein [Muribaculaceae bacterium]